MWQVAGRRRRPPAARAAAEVRAGHTCEAAAAATFWPRGSVEEVAGLDVGLAAQRAEARVRDRAAALRGSAALLAAESRLAALWAEAGAAIARPDTVAASSAAAPVASAGTAATAQEDASGSLLCLGIGAVEASNASACQLAFAWLVAEALGIRHRSWSDPQMGLADIAAGAALGFSAAAPATALAGLAAAEVSAERRVLLFMPHCDRCLYEQALAATLGRVPGLPQDSDGIVSMSERTRLASVVLIGNSFQLYAARDELGIVPFGSPGAPVAHSLMRELRPFTLEELLPEYTPCPEAFNDLALISFSSEEPAREGRAGARAGPAHGAVGGEDRGWLQHGARRGQQAERCSRSDGAST